METRNEQSAEGLAELLGGFTDQLIEGMSDEQKEKVMKDMIQKDIDRLIYGLSYTFSKFQMTAQQTHFVAAFANLTFDVNINVKDFDTVEESREYAKSLTPKTDA